MGALTRLAGWTAYDIGQHGLAQRYFYQAFRLARAARDKALCGRILAGMSHQANFLGHFEHAVHLARAASHGAHGYATPTAMALFQAMEARALASQGNKVETETALSVADRWFELREPENDPEWLRYFDQSELHAEFAHCYRELVKPDLAQYHATASITEAGSLYVRSVSFVRTVLAAAHLQAGELEHAIEVARGVVDTAAHLNSYRIQSYLDDFQTRLAAAGDSRLLTSFSDYAHDTLGLERPPLTGSLVVT